MINSIKKADVKNKKVFVRADLNVPMKDGKVIDNSRIERLMPTVKYIIENGGSVILASHFARPKGKIVPEMSLKHLKSDIEKSLGNNILFSDEVIGNNTKSMAANLKPGEVLLIENLRFHAEEEKNDENFAKNLASMADIYVNDTFSCSHRSHASIDAITNFLPSYAGLLLAEEIENLEGKLNEPAKPIMAIVGGSKVSTKLELLKSLSQKVDFLVIGGAMANSFLKAQNYEIGKSLYEAELLKTCTDITNIAKAHNCELILPIDITVANELANNVSAKVINLDNIEKDDLILDIGSGTVELIKQKIDLCKTIVWNGPLGAFEYKPFDKSTKALAKYIISKQNLVSVAGGGDIVAAISEDGLDKGFSYISAGGGAFLEWLEGIKLPGIRALEDAAKKLSR